MKRRILLLMMTALLSVGAWAENLWSGSETLNYSNFITLPTASHSISMGGILTFTISSTSGEWPTLKLNKISNYWVADELVAVNVSEGTISIIVNETIATAAVEDIAVYGGTFTITSVDYEKPARYNVFTNSSGESVMYNDHELSKDKLAGVQKGDMLEINITGTTDDWGANFQIYSPAQWNSGTQLLSTTVSYGASTKKIVLTDELVSAAHTNGLFLNGGNYTYTSVDIVYAPMLANAADNTDVINYWQSISTNVTLADRTLTKDGDWNTLCLPFALTSSQIDASPLAGAIIKELNTSLSSLDSDGTLTLYFTTATEIVAGKPYIVKWTDTSGSVENPLFEGVTITATTPTAVEFNNAGGGNCKFVGQFSPFTINDGNKDKIIMLGSGSKLGYSQNARTLKTFRAHFEVPTGAGARAFVMNFGDEETTGIISVQGSGSMVNGSDAWYSLGGQRLQGAPTAKGVYIQNGRKVVVK